MVVIYQRTLFYFSRIDVAENFAYSFPGEPVPSRQGILVNKLKTTDKKPDRKRTVMIQEKLEDTGARLQTS
jgi:hypothetical protein